MRDWNELQRDNVLKRELPTLQEISARIQGAHHAYQQSRAEGLAADYQYDILYDAAYKWCEVVLVAEGWRTTGTGHHETVFSSFRHFVGASAGELAWYLDGCRRVRAKFHYDWRPDLVSQVEVDELLRAVMQLEEIVLNWLHNNHPDLSPSEL